MNWRWFFSRSVRQAGELRKQVWYILNSQRDLLADKAREEVQKGLATFDAAMKTARGAAAVKEEMTRLERTATQWLKPYPNPGVRENIKEFLVSGVLILSVFTFFVQPMKIPSGSAQPTLFGNVVTDLSTVPGAVLPDRFHRFIDWFRGVDYHEWIAQDDGELRVGAVATSFGFVKTQRLAIGNDSYTFYWPPDYLLRDGGIHPGQTYKRGDVVFRLMIRSGDRLFVDRLSYNFRRPERGDIIVFHTVDVERRLRAHGGQPLVPDTHYIKRLVALGGEEVRVGDDRHLVINGQRLDTNTPGFSKVYSFTGPPKDSVYSGHVNNKVAAQYGMRGSSPMFPDGSATFTVRTNHYLAFGDNTMNSYDGRAWGDFPREHVVGKALFVFWPFTSRFGPIWR